MAASGSKGKEACSEAVVGADDERSWSKIVQGGPRRAVWSSHRISAAEIEDLQRFFTKVVELEEEEVEESRSRWEDRSLFVRSLGRRVSAGWVARDFKLKLKLDDEPEVFSLAEDHLLVRFKEELICSRALDSGPWFIGGQLLAVEPWQSDFLPSRSPIRRTVVWLRLPELPVKFWATKALLKIAAEAGKPLQVDDFTENLKRFGFARVKLDLDSSLPLVPGVLLRGRKGLFWQRFQYENLPEVCFRCGRMGHGEKLCGSSGVSGGWGREGLDGGGEAEAEGEGLRGSQGPRAGSGCAGGAAGEVRPSVGPWLVTTRVQLPRASRAPAGGLWAQEQAGGRGAASSGPGSSSSPLGSSRPASSPSLSPPDARDWQKPTKVARRRSPAGAAAVFSSDEAEAGLAFSVLNSLDDCGEVGGVGMGGAVDVPMVDLAAGSLKRARSPVLAFSSASSAAGSGSLLGGVGRLPPLVLCPPLWAPHWVVGVGRWALRACRGRRVGGWGVWVVARVGVKGGGLDLLPGCWGSCCGFSRAGGVSVWGEGAGGGESCRGGLLPSVGEGGCVGEGGFGVPGVVAGAPSPVRGDVGVEGPPAAVGQSGLLSLSHDATAMLLKGALFGGGVEGSKSSGDEV